MRWFACLSLLAFSLAACAEPSDDAYRGVDPVQLQQIRDQFETATHSGRATLDLIRMLDGIRPTNPAQRPPIYIAYRAALEGLVGKHSLRPWVKYQRAKTGVAQFQKLAEAYPESTEIRMLRFSLYSQLPNFFHMQPQAEADLVVLTQLLEQNENSMLPEKLRQRYVQWILDNGHPKKGIRQRLEAILAVP